jgi:hypothetical protein
MITLIAAVTAVSVLLCCFISYKFVRFLVDRRKSYEESQNFSKVAAAKRLDNEFKMVGANLTEVRTDTMMYECDFANIKLTGESDSIK